MPSLGCFTDEIYFPSPPLYRVLFVFKKKAFKSTMKFTTVESKYSKPSWTVVTHITVWSDLIVKHCLIKSQQVIILIYYTTMVSKVLFALCTVLLLVQLVLGTPYDEGNSLSNSFFFSQITFNTPFKAIPLLLPIRHRNTNVNSSVLNFRNSGQIWVYHVYHVHSECF